MKPTPLKPTKQEPLETQLVESSFSQAYKTVLEIGKRIDSYQGDLTQAVAALAADIGELTDLTTDEKSTLVGAVNELVTKLTGKQNTLISGQNIKTVNGNSLLGSGNIVIEGGGGGGGVDLPSSAAFIKTNENGEAIAGIPDTFPDESSNNLITSGGVAVGLSDKQDTLSSAQLDATNSGITAAKVSTYDGYNSRINGKQDTLVSGQNVKTINGQSVLGAGNISIQGGGGGTVLPNSAPYIKTNASGEAIAGTVDTTPTSGSANLISSSAVATALGNVQEKITGGASTITDVNLPSGRVLVSNSDGKVAVSSVTDTQLGYLSGATSNIQQQLNTKVPQTRTINGHALTGDVELDQTDVGLDAVVNTGDSDTPVQNGTNKFTTGGAYQFLLNFAPPFNPASTYHSGDFVTYNNRVYVCSAETHTGPWYGGHFIRETFAQMYMDMYRRSGVTSVNGQTGAVSISIPVKSVNGYTGDVELDKSDIGLGSVIDTGDSATPVSGGTTKFTTGGAYTMKTTLENTISTGLSAKQDLIFDYVIKDQTTFDYWASHVDAYSSVAILEGTYTREASSTTGIKKLSGSLHLVGFGHVTIQLTGSGSDQFTFLTGTTSGVLIENVDVTVSVPVASIFTLVTLRNCNITQSSSGKGCYSCVCTFVSISKTGAGVAFQSCSGSYNTCEINTSALAIGYYTCHDLICCNLSYGPQCDTQFTGFSTCYRIIGGKVSPKTSSSTLSAGSLLFNSCENVSNVHITSNMLVGYNEVAAVFSACKYVSSCFIDWEVTAVSAPSGSTPCSANVFGPKNSGSMSFIQNNDVTVIVELSGAATSGISLDVQLFGASGTHVTGNRVTFLGDSTSSVHKGLYVSGVNVYAGGSTGAIADTAAGGYNSY